MDVHSVLLMLFDQEKEKRVTKWKCARKIVHISDGFASDIL